MVLTFLLRYVDQAELLVVQDHLSRAHQVSFGVPAASDLVVYQWSARSFDMAIVRSSLKMVPQTLQMEYLTCLKVLNSLSVFLLTRK